MTGVIVVGVDSSETAKRAAEAAREMAIALGTDLHVVTAFENNRHDIVGSGSDLLVISSADAAKKVPAI
jgi:nucleotide-binding universal stress UspA family protein